MEGLYEIFQISFSAVISNKIFIVILFCIHYIIYINST